MESNPYDGGGWSRSAQDAAEVELRSEPREPRPVPFLDRPVGNASVRWLVALVAGILGGIAGFALGAATFSSEPFGGLFIVPLAFAGFLAAAFLTSIGLRLAEHLGKRKLN